MDLLHEFDLSTGLLSRDDRNEEDLDDEADEVDGMFKFDVRSLDFSKLLIFLELLLPAPPVSPEPELVLGLILRKLDVDLEVPDPEAPAADSSSLLCRPLLRRKVFPSISPDLRNDPDPPGLQDIFHQSLQLTSCLLQNSQWLV